MENCPPFGLTIQSEGQMIPHFGYVGEWDNDENLNLEPSSPCDSGGDGSFIRYL